MGNENENGRSIPLSGGLKCGGRFRTTLAILDSMSEAFMKAKTVAITCDGCQKKFYVAAGLKCNPNFTEMALQHWNDVNDPEQTGFDRFVAMNQATFRQWQEGEFVIGVNCEWHEELEE